MKKKFGIAGGLVLIAIISFTFFQNKSVETIGYKIQSSNYKEVITSIGTVEYNGLVEIKSEVSGKLLEFNKDIGDKINVGNGIVKIDNSQALLDYNEMINKSTLVKARYEDYMDAYNENVKSIEDQRLLQEKEIESLKLEKIQLNETISINKELLSKGAVPAKELDNLNDQMELLKLRLETAETKLTALRVPVLAVQEIKASIDAANANINKQENELKKYSLESPIDGIIIDRKVEEGTFIQAGETLLEVASDREKYAVIELDEKYISKVSIGKDAQISIEAYPGEIIKGTVVKISPEVNKDTGTIDVKVKILEKKQLFLQNMAVNVEFVGDIFENTITIPGEYLVDDKVYLKDENGLAVKKKVVIYNKNNSNVRIMEGLKPGDIILNPKNLEEGIPVKVIIPTERESSI